MPRLRSSTTLLRQTLQAVAVRVAVGSGVAMLTVGGCTGPQRPGHRETSVRYAAERHARGSVVLAAHKAQEPESRPPAKPIAPDPFMATGSLRDLERLAEQSNPSLGRLRNETAAARAHANYIDKLPDPVIGANIFAHPIETAAGSQRANLTVMQRLPWLKRLDAAAQAACLEALAAEQIYHVERLKVIGDVRAAWYRMYVIDKQIASTKASQQLLTRLIETANAAISVGRASPGDVQLGTVEYGRLEERVLSFQQRLNATQADLNRLVGHPADTPLQVPKQIDVSLPDWSHPLLRQLAWEHQPAIAAAQVRTQATRWGIEVARLKRRPDVTLNASWFAIDGNRPATSVVDVGEDAWSVGAQLSLPLWHRKYDAMVREASSRHSARHATVDELKQHFDSALRDLWVQAQAADETARLYKDSIIPDAQQVVLVDQQAYSNGTVEFDRVIGNFRTLLTLELGYHRAIGQLAVALARIRQAIGVELAPEHRAPELLPDL